MGIGSGWEKFENFTEFSFSSISLIWDPQTRLSKTLEEKENDHEDATVELNSEVVSASANLTSTRPFSRTVFKVL